MEIFVDTSAAVRQADIASADQVVAEQALSLLDSAGHSLIIAAQTIVEFWAVATRPRSANGLGLALPFADQEPMRLESLLELRSNPPGLYNRWVRLVNDHGVSGKQVHDTRLVAFMLESGITTVLTFNIADFARFPDIVVSILRTFDKRSKPKANAIWARFLR